MTARAGTATRTCIIGAGASGIAAAKALHERGCRFDCFERSDRVGGLWSLREGEPQASYRSLECNTSKRRTEFSDFPMPASFPHYPSHRDMEAYLNAYVDHFGFRHRIALGRAVAHARPAGDGGWEIELDGGGGGRYDVLVVANGHHREPRWPQPPAPGDFAGRQLHVHDYLGPEDLPGSSVVVVGIGNSAMDVAVDASDNGHRVYLSARRGAHIVPKYLLGHPIDRFDNPLPVPWPVKRAFFSLVQRSTIGRPEDVGLPRPAHRLDQAHPTLSQHILDRVRRGSVVPKPAIAELRGRTVRFADGSEAEADAIVYCTGYDVSFPFFDPGLVPVVDNRVDLYRNVFPPNLPNLAFVGLVQPFGALIPVVEAQSQWIGDWLTGRCRLPTPEAMTAEIERERERRERRFVASPRHTLEIDFYPYLRAIRRERRRTPRELTRAARG